MKNVFLFLFLVIGPVFLQKGLSQSHDSLLLKNGQTLAGVFLGWQNTDISFLIFDAGVVTVNYKNVSMLHGNFSEYRIETSTRKVFYDKLRCMNSSEFLFKENANPVSVPFKNIHSITPYKKGGIVHGYIGIGYNYARSNDFGLFTLDGGLNFRSKKWLIEGGAMSSIVQTKISGLDRNRDYLILKTHRIINPSWQFGARYLYQRNKELGLAYRHLIGAGAELNAIKRQNFLMNISSGLAGALESTFDEQDYSRIEIPILLEIKVSNLGGTNVSLSHTQSLFISTGGNRRIRHDGELRINMQLTKKLFLTTYIYDNYDSAPLQTLGTTNLDYGWNTGLKLSL